ncbi:hypothetical protein F4779DRAFT_530910 [Xylariaceae sp. FL0662B]|nr:hypothetical protein F4779DRAFT_530910 [Xylariaceae sp. FL0662B]
MRRRAICLFWCPTIRPSTYIHVFLCLLPGTSLSYLSAYPAAQPASYLLVEAVRVHLASTSTIGIYLAAGIKTRSLLPCGRRVCNLPECFLSLFFHLQDKQLRCKVPNTLFLLYLICSHHMQSY